MAGFLFRKQKQDHNNRSSVAISTPTTLQSPPTTPLYARLSASSPRDAIGAATPVRKVSLPKPLGQSRGQRGNGVEGKYGYSSNSLTSVDRDGHRKNMKVQDVVQRPQLSGEHSFERPTPQLLVDKPLPPPVPPDEDKPTIPATASFARPRPTAFPQQIQGRMSLSSDKPLPRPQSFLPIPTSTPLKNSISRTRTTSSSVMQSAVIQNKTQQQWSSPTPNQKIFNDPNHGESTTMKTEDSPVGTPPIAETPAPPISSISSDSISSTKRTSGKGSSESVKDHPEALSSQVSFLTSSTFCRFGCMYAKCLLSVISNWRNSTPFSFQMALCTCNGCGSLIIIFTMHRLRLTSTILISIFRISMKSDTFQVNLVPSIPVDHLAALLLGNLSTSSPLSAHLLYVDLSTHLSHYLTPLIPSGQGSWR
jgi:hypothetical protein